jgi:hypothetical protein
MSHNPLVYREDIENNLIDFVAHATHGAGELLVEILVHGLAQPAVARPPGAPAWPDLV